MQKLHYFSLHIHGKGICIFLLLFFILTRSQISSTNEILYVQSGTLFYIHDSATITIVKDKFKIRNTKLAKKNEKKRIIIAKNEKKYPIKKNDSSPFKNTYTSPIEKTWSNSSYLTYVALLPTSFYSKFKTKSVGYIDDDLYRILHTHNQQYTIFKTNSQPLISQGYYTFSRSRPPPNHRVILI
ncbi:hypothetical protein [Chryseobacterium potabilaquae]|uniref:Uncharacterized protein n=1 Tax=Chryseobacterium potabilaquae TaxID=2675057 RepID=A0A6N4XCZ2_9FLAO|nr:hypothetical protein [Chryseobacterium potabilaquae]CAA7197334.1 hypothetical protein CHRY9293_03389 [Chryseobacterium potabilaquae]